MATIPPLLTRSDVASMLDIPLKTLTWWFWALDEGRRYTEFDIQRRNGELRGISAPIKPIKEVQQRLAALLLSWYAAPTHVHGFVSERDPRSNARPHRRQQWVLKADLADFFPSINFGRVRGLFMAFPFDFPWTIPSLTETGLPGFRPQEMRSKEEERSTVPVIA